MAAAAPYILAIGGAALKSQADAQQAKEQRSQLNAALTRTDQTQEKSNSLITQEAAKLAPATRVAALDTQAAANLGTSQADLAAAGATDPSGNAIIDTVGDDGAVSREFMTDKANRALQEGDRLTSIAKELARTRAPGQLVSQEGQDRAALTEQLGSMWDTTQNLNGANVTTAQGIEAPAYGQLGELAQAAGQAYASKGKGLAVKKTKPGAATIWAGDDTTGGYA